MTLGAKFWAGLVGYVFVADVVLIRKRSETMSATFVRWNKRPIGRALCPLAVGYMVSHLFFKTPLFPGSKRFVKILQKGIDKNDIAKPRKSSDLHE